MLQNKLLIAMGALTLAACGGSLDLGPKTPAPPIQDDPEEEEGELVRYELPLTTDRNWYTKGNYQDENDVPPDVEFIEDGIQIYVTSPNQQLVTEIDDVIDFRRAEAVFTVSADEEYLSTAGASQPFQQAFIRSDNSPDDDDELGGNWGCYTGMGDWEADTPVEITCNVTNADIFNIEEGQYMLIGIQSQVDGAQGYLRLHEIALYYYVGGAPEPEPVGGGELELAVDDSGNWEVHDDGASVEFTDSGVAFTPAFDGEFQPKLAYMYEGPVDLTGQTLTLEVTVEEAFVEAGADLDAIVQQNFDSFSQHACNVAADEFTADEPVTIVCEEIPDTMVAEEGQFFRLGLQVNSSASDVGRITINRISITLPGNETALAMDESGAWDVQDDDANVQFTEDGAAFSPTFSGEYGAKLVYMMEGPVEMADGSFTVSFSVEQAFIDAGASVHAHIQQNFGSYTQHQCSPEGDLEAGEVYTITCDEIPEAMDAEEGEVLRIGIQVDNMADGTDVGLVTVHSLSISPR